MPVQLDEVAEDGKEFLQLFVALDALSSGLAVLLGCPRLSLVPNALFLGDALFHIRRHYPRLVVQGLTISATLAVP